MDAEARALVWRCRRGMKELDVLLERYAAATLPQAGAAERRLLARLLERPDPELASYFLGGVVPPEPDIAALVTRITASQPARAEWQVPGETVHHGARRFSTESKSVTGPGPHAPSEARITATAGTFGDEPGETPEL